MTESVRGDTQVSLCHLFIFVKRGVVMADTIDSLQIEIDAKATKANDAIDRLVGKLNRLTTSLSAVDGASLRSLANGVERLGNAMQVMNTIKTADFTRLATNLTKLGTVNVSALNSAADSTSRLTRAFDSLGTVSANAQAVGNMAKNIAKLGNKSVQTAITNIPQLATAMNGLMATLSKAPRVSQNVIQMTNALANLTSQGSKVGSASNSLVRELNKTSSSANTAKKSFGGLASAIGKFYAKYFMVIRGLKGLWSSIESTADYIEAYNYFNVALGKIGSDWSYQWEKYGYDNAESYVDSFRVRLSEKLGKLSGLQVSIGTDGQGLLTESGMKNLGLNIQEITQYASQLASVTNSIGQTGEVSLAVASSFTKLAGDISSLFNVDYSSVSKNLQSGLIGQSRALYKYGIDITNATLQTYAYNLGLSKSVSEMTQAEKMQLRMLAILDQSKVSWGDLANTINSPSNMIRQFKNNIKETGMVLGQLFIPVLQKALPVINGVTIAIKRLLVDIAGLLGIKIDFDAFGQGYSDIEDELEDSADAFEEATGKAKEYKNQLLGFDEINKLSDTADASGTNEALGDTIDLTDEIIDATNRYEKAWNDAFKQMENNSQIFADKIEKILSPIANPFKNLLKDISNGDWFLAGQDVNQMSISILEFINKAISNVDTEQVGESIGKFLKGVDLFGIFKEVLKLKLNFWVMLGEVISESFDEAPIETALLVSFGLINYTPIGRSIWNGIIGSMSAGTGGAVAGSGIAGKLFGGVTSAWASLGGLSGILTADLSTILAAGTITEICLAIGVGIAGSVLAGFIGYDLGTKINQAITGEKLDMSMTEQWAYLAGATLSGEVVQAFGKSIGELSSKLIGNESSLHNWFMKNILGEDGSIEIQVDADTAKASEAFKSLQSQILDLQNAMNKANATDVTSIQAFEEELSKTIQSRAETVAASQRAFDDYNRSASILRKYVGQIYNGTYEEFQDFYGAGEDLAYTFEILETIGKSNTTVLNEMYKELGLNKTQLQELDDEYHKHKAELDTANEKVSEASSRLNTLVNDYQKATNEVYIFGNASVEELLTIEKTASTTFNSLVVTSENGANAMSDNFKESMADIKKTNENTWNDVYNKIVEKAKSSGEMGGNNLLTMFESKVNKVPDAAKSAFAGIVSRVNSGDIGYEMGKTLVDKLTAAVSDSAKPFQSTFASLFSGDISLTDSSGKKQLTKAVFTPSITPKAYAVGGYVDSGELFIAREAGPEYVGKIGASTAVANNDQITTAISSAVYNAVCSALSQYSNQGNSTTIVEIDGREVFNAVKLQSDNYARITGRSAFS